MTATVPCWPASPRTVRAKRLAAGLSMRALAAKAGMSQPFLSNLENGRAMPSIATLYKIAAALGVSARDFLAVDEPATVAVVRAGEGPAEPGRRRADVGALAPGRRRPGAGASRRTLRRRGRRDARRLVRARRRGPARGASRGGCEVEFADGQRHDLGAGDVLWHVSTIAHRWRVVARRRRACCWSTPTPPPTAHGG